MSAWEGSAWQLARARNNFRECGVMPGEDVKP